MVVGHVVAVGTGVSLGCDDEVCVRDSYPCYCCCWGFVGRWESMCERREGEESEKCFDEMHFDV